MIVNRESVIVHILVILFGAGAWIAVNGVWVELPLIVNQLPESWTLPAYLTVISQVGNLGPIIVTIMQAFFTKYYRQNAMIYSIVTVGTLACLLLCFFWSKTVVISGEEYSLALFILWYILAFVDCSSSVTFLPFMTIFPSMFLTTYFFGEGLSGLFPSIFALIQGTGNSQCINESYVNETTNITEYHLVAHYTDPRFSVEVFFGLLCIMMAMCSISFILLNHLNIAKQLHIHSEDVMYSKGLQTEDVPQGAAFTQEIELETSSSSLGGPRSSPDKPNEPNDASASTLVVPIITKLGHGEYVYLLFLICIVNALSNGILPSVSSYTALPYGEVPYHLATSLGNMANPLACLFAFFFPMASYIGIGIFSLLSSGFAGYLLFLALGSPCPILVNETSGAVLMVLSQILFVGTASYVKVSIAQIFRQRGHKRSLVWYGGIVQFGSMAGALTMFPLVNIYNKFQSGIPCEFCP